LDEKALTISVTGIILQLTHSGLYCAAGDFYVDPWLPVDRAVITHAHADHACPGSRAYLAARAGAALLRARVGGEAAIEALDYGEVVNLGSVRVSLHPAGHILGSAQVRIESGGEVWVVSGDYTTAARSNLRGVRASRLPHIRHGIHFRPADLPLAARGRGIGGDPELVGRQPTGRQSQRAVRL
jgi:Cft2 family RNA processing exonuclease